jgi:hypothetical protein
MRRQLSRVPRGSFVEARRRRIYCGSAKRSVAGGKSVQQWAQVKWGRISAGTGEVSTERLAVRVQAAAIAHARLEALFLGRWGGAECRVRNFFRPRATLAHLLEGANRSRPGHIFSYFSTGGI